MSSPLSRSSSARSRLAMLAAVATSLLAPTGAAATSFPAGTQLSDAYPSISNARVAVDDAGDAVAVWVSSTQAAQPASLVTGRVYTPPKTLIQVSTRSAGGAFGQATTVSTVGTTSSAPLVVMDARGDATVLWDEVIATGTVVRATTMPAGGTFGAPQTISDPTRVASTPSLAIAADGSATAAWQDDAVNPAGNPSLIQTASRVGLAAFASPIQISSLLSSGSTGPSVAMDARGDTAVGFTDNDSEIWQTQAPAGETLSITKTKMVQGPGENAVAPELAMGPTGTVTFLYLNRTQSSSTGQVFELRARQVQLSGTVGPMQSLADPHPYVDTAITADRTGRVTVVFQYPVPGNGSVGVLEVDSATATPGGTFSAAVPLDKTSGGAGPSVASGSDGSVLAAWHTLVNNTFVLVAAIRPAGADTFGAPQTISTVSDFNAPAVAISTPDIATVLWQQQLPGSATPQTATSAVFSSSTGSGVSPAVPVQQPVVASTAPAPALTPVPAPITNPVLTIGAITQTGKKPKKGSKKIPAGPKLISVSVTSTQHVAGRVAITKSLPGVVSKGTKCVAPPKKKAVGKKPKGCIRVLAVGKPVTATIDPGKATIFTFTKKTPPGKYTLSAYGTSTTNVSAKPVSVKFTVK